MVVCDPLHRRYLLLPRIPDDLAASVVDAQGFCHEDSCLVPSGDHEEAAATDEASFRVIWMMLLPTKPVIFVFCSGTRQWRIVPSLTWSEMSPGFELSAHVFYRLMRHYAHGCFYWLSWSTEKLFVLEIRRMAFSVADHPPCERYHADDVVIVEADQGAILMFVHKPNTSSVVYTVWQNNGGSSTSSQWQQMEKPITLDSGSGLMGAVGRHLLLYYCGGTSVGRSCFTQDVNTFQLERVCSAYPKQTHAYCNFPPSLLSSPTVSIGTHHADIQGAGDDVPVPQLRESDFGGMEGPVVLAAARASNPLFVVEAAPHADVRRQVGDVVRVPELREAGPEGVTLCNAGTPHVDVHGAGDDVPVRELQKLTLETCKDLLLQRPPELLTPVLTSKAHPMVTSRERGMMCRCLNYKKLTLEVCKDLVLQRLPKLRPPLSSSKPHPMLTSGKRRTLCRCLNHEKLALKA
ncbi:hypothetical protein ACQJBY_013411 [Aegilops geniculata]